MAFQLFKFMPNCSIKTMISVYSKTRLEGQISFPRFNQQYLM